MFYEILTAAQNGVYTFLQNNGFAVEMMIAAALSTWWLRKRSHIVTRYAVAIVVLMLFSIIWSVAVPYDMWTQIARYIVFFGVLVALSSFCLDIKGIQVLFYMVFAGLLQHFAFRSARIAADAARVFAQIPSYYVDVVYVVALIPMYVVGYAVFVNPVRGKRIERLKRSRILALFAGVLLCINVFTNVVNDLNDQRYDGMYAVFVCFDLVNCVFMMELLREVVDRLGAEESSAVMQHLLEQQKQQLESSKDTVDLINVKTHDLKKRLISFGERLDNEEIDELNELVAIYDSSVNTGNESLDVVLKQKALLCERRHIQFDRMIDGACLSFMKPADIYGLFGNAIDNALEALDDVADVQRRYINVSVRNNRGMVVIRFENPYLGELSFENGLPRTTKGDERYHGFGTLSIRMIAERYHGYMSIAADDGVYVLTVVIPRG